MVCAQCVSLDCVFQLSLDYVLQIGYGSFAMSIFSGQRDLLRRRRRLHTRFQTRAVQSWAFALLGMLLLAVPTVRTNELSEVGGAQERVEDASLVTSVVSLKRTTNHGRREAIVFTSSIQARLGRDQRPQRVPAPGHRLPNGLMAPMTC
jgi:hypothetical protein